MTSTAARRAIQRAERVLPGEPAPEGKSDPRWQAIISVAEYIGSDPITVWEFAHKWGRHPNADLRMAVATCLLEHLLEYHFDLIFPKVEEAVGGTKRLAETFTQCAKFGQSEIPRNAERFDRLVMHCRSIG